MMLALVCSFINTDPAEPFGNSVDPDQIASEEVD